MKLRLLALAMMLCALPLSAVAGSKQSATIDLYQAVVISGTQLQPGEYQVRWDGSDTDVKVQFLKGNKELVSVSAKLVNQRNSKSPSVTTRLAGNGSQTISEIGLSKVTLKFAE